MPRGVKGSTMGHGTQSGYRHGCRCDGCRAAWNVVERARYSKKKRSTRAWIAANRERVREAQNVRNRRRQYGLSPSDFAALIRLQDGRCAICRRPLDGSRKAMNPHVDHDHAAGRVRGLLCNSCNRALGFMRDDPAALRRAADYLERFRQDTELEG